MATPNPSPPGATPGNGTERLPLTAGGLVECAQIQAVLFDYMARELGDGQSLLVHEHLRRCDACRAEAADIQTTLALLHAHDPGAHTPPHLSERSHRRLIRAVMHPVIDWVFVHHWLVALFTALAVVALTILCLSWTGSDDTAPRIWIIIRPKGG